MNKESENERYEIEGTIVEVRPDERSKRKVGVYLEDKDGERSWYDYWKSSSRDALPGALREDNRVRLTVEIKEGDQRMFRDIVDVEKLNGQEGQREAQRRGQRCDDDLQLPPPCDRLVDRLVGVYGADRGEVLGFVVRMWYHQNGPEIERMIELVGDVDG